MGDRPAHPPGEGLVSRLMASFAAFTLAVCALFGLFAMAFVYAVEDRYIEQLLDAEAQQQRAHHAAHGRWAPPSAAHFSVHDSAATLPAEMQAVLAAEPQRREIAGGNGRHYHLAALAGPGQPPWLVVEASQLLIVRPIRQELIGWLVGWGLAVAALALLLAWFVGRNFEALLARTRAFLAREQAFTRDASHELRTPLSVLRLAIERWLASPGLEADTRAQLAPMHAATLLMEQTVQTLLLQAREDAAAGGSGQPAPPVAVLPLVEQWVLAHAAWLDTQPLQLDIQLQRHDTLALPAPVLQLALANLLGNAFAHGQPGGRVSVALVGGALCIANPGAAVPPPAAGAEFVKGEGSAGFGLGLSILRRLLEQHGSRLDVQHDVGQTCVCIAVAAPRPG
jgi:signal transduction histidine kinase